MKQRTLFFLLLGLSLSAPTLWAQTTDSSTLASASSQRMGDNDFERGILAFRDKDFAKAISFFDGIQSSDAKYAEAQFMLARIFTETPLADGKKARGYLQKALQKEPDNVTYLTARLEQLRSPSNNFISERLKDSQRRDLALKLLKLDSKNAFAHEEIGLTYINDYWRYRNAINIPQFTQALHPRRLSEREGTSQNKEAVEGRQQNTAGEDNQATDPNAPNTGTSLNDPAFDTSDPFNLMAVEEAERLRLGNNPVFLNDQFDIEAMKIQGVSPTDLRGRGEYSYRKALEHLRQALVSDPMRRSVYDQLMKVYALKEDYHSALEMLKTMLSFFPDDPNVILYTALTQYHLGDMQAAATNFEEAFKIMDPQIKAKFEDIGILLPVKEQEAYKADPLKYANRFWSSQEARFLTAYNERRLEHYARIVYADLLYSAPKLKKRGWETQRGQILIRYGVPLADIVIEDAGNLGKRDASWSSNDIGSNTSTNSSDPNKFLNPNERSNTYMEDMFDGVKNTTLFNIWSYGTFKFVFEDPYRNGSYEFYEPNPDEIAAGVDPYRNDYTIISKQIFKETPEKYEYKAPGRQVQLPYLVNAFKGKDGKADLYVHSGIPVQNYDATKDNIPLNINVGTFLIGEDRNFLVERRQTMYGLKTAQVEAFKEANLWVYTQAMNIPAGAQTISVEFETAGGNTVGVQRRNITIPDFNQDKLMLSDVMLAYNVVEAPDGKPAKAGDLVRKDLSIRPAPWSVFGKKNPIYLYFEIYNLTQQAGNQTKFQVEAILSPKQVDAGFGVSVRNLFRGKEKGVSVKFDGSGTTKDDGQYLIIDANDQKEGLYSLTLRLKDLNSGKTTEMQKDLFLE